jgi:DegV family protein with EDD domain
MSKVAVVTDSVACIPENLLNDLKIHTIPFYIHRGSEALLDLVNIGRETFYKWLPTTNVLPKTANPGPGDYLAKYTELAAKGFKEIVSVQITSAGSGAYRAAMAAKQLLRESIPEIKLDVIDTLNASMCQGWMAIEAARAALADASLEDIGRIVRGMMPKTRFFHTTDTLNYLYMGGRIGKAKHLLASLLDIKPIISMEDGIIVSLGQARTRSKVYQLMVEKLEQIAGNSAMKVAYIHAAAREEAEKLKSLVESRVEVIESLITEFTPALGVHTGPGTVGLCYYLADTP